MKTLLLRPAPPDARGWSTRPRSRIGRRGVIAFLIVALAGGLFVSVPPRNASADSLSDAYAQQKQLEKQIAAQKAKIAALSSSQAALGRRISSTRATLSSVVDDLTKVRTDIVGMTVDVAKAQSAVDELVTSVALIDDQLLSLERQEAAKAAELSERRSLLAERLRTAYDTDRQSMLETLLSSGDFSDVLTEVSYHLDFADQDKALAEQIAEDQQVLAVLHVNTELTRQQAELMRAAADKQQALLAKQLAGLRDAKERLAKLQAQYEELLREQQARARELAASKAQAESLLSKMRRAERRLEKLIDRLVWKALQEGGIPSQYSGSLHWPMATGWISQPFGCTGFYLEPPLGSCAHFHRGIDIAAPAGTPIHAAGPGKVIYVGKAPYDPAYIVIIAHSSKLWSGYWHVRTHIPVHVGQFVNTGQVIAYEGCTGWCTGPHLHWAVNLNDSYVNPRLFL